MKKELLVKNLGWESYRGAVSYTLIVSGLRHDVAYFDCSTEALKTVREPNEIFVEYAKAKVVSVNRK